MENMIKNPNVAVVIGDKIFHQQPTSAQTAENPIIINLPPVDPNHEREQIQKYFPKRAMMLLSILQIACGGLVFLMQVRILIIFYQFWLFL